MNKSNQNLAQSIKLKFGTGPAEPNELQLKKIKEAVVSLGKGSNTTTEDWNDIVSKYCPTAGKYSYSGIDNSDLNALLSIASKP